MAGGQHPFAADEEGSNHVRMPSTALNLGGGLFTQPTRSGRIPHPPPEDELATMLAMDNYFEFPSEDESDDEDFVLPPSALYDEDPGTGRAANEDEEEEEGEEEEEEEEDAENDAEEDNDDDDDDDEEGEGDLDLDGDGWTTEGPGSLSANEDGNLEDWLVQYASSTHGLLAVDSMSPAAYDRGSSVEASQHLGQNLVASRALFDVPDRSVQAGHDHNTATPGHPDLEARTRSRAVQAPSARSDATPTAGSGAGWRIFAGGAGLDNGQRRPGQSDTLPLHIQQLAAGEHPEGIFSRPHDASNIVPALEVPTSRAGTTTLGTALWANATSEASLAQAIQEPLPTSFNSGNSPNDARLGSSVAASQGDPRNSKSFSPADVGSHTSYKRQDRREPSKKRAHVGRASGKKTEEPPMVITTTTRSGRQVRSVKGRTLRDIVDNDDDRVEQHLGGDQEDSQPQPSDGFGGPANDLDNGDSTFELPINDAGKAVSSGKKRKLDDREHGASGEAYRAVQHDAGQQQRLQEAWAGGLENVDPHEPTRMQREQVYGGAGRYSEDEDVDELEDDDDDDDHDELSSQPSFHVKPDTLNGDSKASSTRGRRRAASEKLKALGITQHRRTRAKLPPLSPKSAAEIRRQRNADQSKAHRARRRQRESELLEKIEDLSSELEAARKEVGTLQSKLLAVTGERDGLLRVVDTFKGQSTRESSIPPSTDGVECSQEAQRSSGRPIAGQFSVADIAKVMTLLTRHQENDRDKSDQARDTTSTPGDSAAKEPPIPKSHKAALDALASFLGRVSEASPLQ